MADDQPWRRLADADATARLGAEIAAYLRAGDAVCLYGPLGAGKSTLARSLIRALTRPDEDVPSPTFTLVQVYDGPDFPIAHFDLYRLTSAEEAYEIGLEEALETGAAVIEWPERLEGDLPAARLDVEMAIPSDLGSGRQIDERLVRLTGHGPWISRRHALEQAWSNGNQAVAVKNAPHSRPESPGLSERDAVKRAFLAAAGLAEARAEPMPGDASTRSYTRLHRPGLAPLILMDAPKAAESAPCGPDASPEQRAAAGYNALQRLAACRVDAFVGADLYLRSLGFSAPEVAAFDVESGFAVLEDLGQDLFARRIEAGEPPEPFYEAAIDLLIRLHTEPAPPELPVPGHTPWPLLAYDALALKTATDLLPQWLPRLAPGVKFSPDARAAWDGLWAPIWARGEAGATVFAHRDYHAENLIWLDKREGLGKVGLLDFQDAVKAHPAWDLVSLLQDARRDVAPELEAAMLERYLNAGLQPDREAFLADYAALATLNNARIVGIFARLIARDGKPRYRAFLPRMWRLLDRNLAHPDLAAVKAWFDRHIPATARA
jgi:tRNA threonylcarbamoyl adenosine modification protein YjeE